MRSSMDGDISAGVNLNPRHWIKPCNVDASSSWQNAGRKITTFRDMTHLNANKCKTVKSKKWLSTCYSNNTYNKMQNAWNMSIWSQQEWKEQSADAFDIEAAGFAIRRLCKSQLVLQAVNCCVFGFRLLPQRLQFFFLRSALLLQLNTPANGKRMTYERNIMIMQRSNTCHKLKHKLSTSECKCWSYGMRWITPGIAKPERMEWHKNC